MQYTPYSISKHFVKSYNESKSCSSFFVSEFKKNSKNAFQINIKNTTLTSHVNTKNNTKSKVYSLKTVQTILVTLNEAWDYFSTPDNLKDIIRAAMGFVIKSKHHGERMYAGK